MKAVDVGAQAISIILPVRNEAGLIVEQLQALQDYRAAGHEVIVVDGSSGDGTAELAAPLADRVLNNSPGRSLQMNAGAAVARHGILLFLHVDSRLPPRADHLIHAALARGDGAWGWFPVRLDNRGRPYRIIGSCMNLRARLTYVCTGDQALFVRRELFDQVGGFPELALMEDVALSKRLRRKSTPGLVERSVRVATRGWEKRGLVHTTLLMWWLRLLFFAGVSPDRLVKLYYPSRD